VSASVSTFVLTYDVGGSHVSAGLCSVADLKVVRVEGAHLAGVDTFEAFADLLHNLGVKAAAGQQSIAGASLAVPFPFDTEAGMSLMEHKLTAFYRRDLRGALAQRFGWQGDQFRFLNDAGAYLLGEVGAGAVKGAKRAVGLTLGTGVGCAFAVDGAQVTEGPGVPPGGEIWDHPYGDGTVEDLISTRALKGEYLARTGRDLEVSAIAAAAEQDADAREVFETFGQHLGEVLRVVVAPFHPDMVVIGGGIARSARLFLPEAEKQITHLGFHVVESALWDQAPLVGAAHFWREATSDARNPSTLSAPR
jgi:glucokinase